MMVLVMRRISVLRRSESDVAHEAGDGVGAELGKLVLRAVAGRGKVTQAQRRQRPAVQRVPVLDREDDVVVAADVQDRDVWSPSAPRGGLGGNCAVFGPAPRSARAKSIGTGKLRSAVRRAMRATERRAAVRLRLRLRLEEQDDVVLRVVLGLAGHVVEQLLGGSNTWWNCSCPLLLVALVTAEQLFYDVAGKTENDAGQRHPVLRAEVAGEPHRGASLARSAAPQRPQLRSADRIRARQSRRRSERPPVPGTFRPRCLEGDRIPILHIGGDHDIIFPSRELVRAEPADRVAAPRHVSAGRTRATAPVPATERGRDRELRAQQLNHPPDGERA